MPTKTTKTAKATKAPKATKEPVAKKKFAFHVDIASSGKHYEAEGDSLHELLLAFPVPSLINTETNILVTKDGKTIQRDLKVADARRCFNGFATTSLELLAISISKQLPH